MKHRRFRALSCVLKTGKCGAQRGVCGGPDSNGLSVLRSMQQLGKGESRRELATLLTQFSFDTKGSAGYHGRVKSRGRVSSDGRVIVERNDGCC
jgi:hypothetical protein